MPWESGTATGHLDFLARLQDFCVGSEMGWELLEETDDRFYLKAPGLDGNQSIYMGFDQASDVNQDYYNVLLNGSRSYIPGATLGNQQGSPRVRVMSLSNQSMPYWLIGNGQRVMGVCQVSGVWQPFYCGFGLRATYPQNYDYPFFVGATGDNSGRRWSDTSNNHRAFFDPGQYGAAMHIEGNSWVEVYNWDNNGTENSNKTHPYNDVEREREFIAEEITDYQGKYPLRQVAVSKRPGSGDDRAGVKMYLDGVFQLPGYQVQAGDIVSQDGTDYLVIQNVFRTSRPDYCALELS